MPGSVRLFRFSSISERPGPRKLRIMIPLGSIPPSGEAFENSKLFFRVAKNKFYGPGTLPVGPNVGFDDGAKRPAACGEIPDTASLGARRFIVRCFFAVRNRIIPIFPARRPHRKFACRTLEPVEKADRNGEPARLPPKIGSIVKTSPPECSRPEGSCHSDETGLFGMAAENPHLLLIFIYY